MTVLSLSARSIVEFLEPRVCTCLPRGLSVAILYTRCYIDTYMTAGRPGGGSFHRTLILLLSDTRHLLVILVNGMRLGIVFSSPFIQGRMQEPGCHW